jgi:glycine cleavage system H protein
MTDLVYITILLTFQVLGCSNSNISKKLIKNKITDDLFFTKTHEWIKYENGLLKIGITDHAQKELGSVDYVGLPEIGNKFAEKSIFAKVETMKAVSDVFMPVGGTVVKINENLKNDPELINKYPYGKGWLIIIKPDRLAYSDKFMNHKQYKIYLESLNKN